MSPVNRHIGNRQWHNDFGVRFRVPERFMDIMLGFVDSWMNEYTHPPPRFVYTWTQSAFDLILSNWDLFGCIFSLLLYFLSSSFPFPFLSFQHNTINYLWTPLLYVCVCVQIQDRHYRNRSESPSERRLSFCTMCEPHFVWTITIHSIITLML